MTQRSRAIHRLESPGAEAVSRSGDSTRSPDVDATVALRAAHSQCTILITGDTGVGKGRLARWIHDHSPRREGPFIPVNCGAIPESLIDSQLFGHVRGAFSGATVDHLGLIRAAEKGTLLLDEVGELPSSAQSRLLRLLQEREVQPVGHSRPLIVDVRVIAASNSDLQAAVHAGRFREDLLFRLDVIRLHIQPLRARLHLIPELLQQFSAELAGLYGRPALQFDPEVLHLLRAYHWPGNIRQLRTLVERLVVLCPRPCIAIDDVLEFGQLNPPPRLDGPIADFNRMRLDQVRRVLADEGGSITRAAAVFGVHRSTLYRWLRSQGSGNR